MNEGVRVFHLRRRVNGVPETNGGYAVAVKARKDGRFNITVSQCNERQRYDERLGDKIATTRMKQGKYFVRDWDGVVETLNTIHDKLCTGETKVKLCLPSKQEVVAASNDEAQPQVTLAA